MEPVALTIGGTLAALALVALLIRDRGGKRAGRGRARPDIEPHAMRAAVEAEMEEHDIDDMLDAISERRRRLGKRDVGEELSDELLRKTWEE